MENGHMFPESEHLEVSFDEMENIKKCEYCEVDVDDRKYIYVVELDYFDVEIYIDGNNNLATDNNMCEGKINFCPMCGRKLG